MKTFPSYTQLDAMDCSPTCLRMIAKHYGRHYSLETLRQHSFITREGVSMLGISDAAEYIGFRTSGVMISFEQLVFFVTRLSEEFIRSWILLHMNTRINIALISDFRAKLMKLPIRYFDTKMTGDIMQRIGDHRRIESFLTGNSISTLFSFVNFFVFAFVLAYCNLVILGIFLAGNALYVTWILLFMKYRRELDYKRFAQSAGEQSKKIKFVSIPE